MVRSTIPSLLLTLLLLVSTLSANRDSFAASPTCPDANLFGKGLVTNICWDCIFPIHMAGTKWGNGTIPPDAITDFICLCDDLAGVPQIGFHLGAWAPVRLIEVVRTPYCSPSLGGTKLHSSVRLQGGHQSVEGDTSDSTFYNYHYYAYPLFIMLEMIMPGECNAGGFRDFDLMYMSELDPSWSDDELAMLLNPEAALFSNPLVRATCAADCASATIGNSFDSMYYCAGCWGHLYPFTGKITAANSPPRSTSLAATRALAALHRRGLAWKTVGSSNLCTGGSIYPMIPKSQYKMSTLYPVPEASSDGNKVLCDPNTEACSGPGGSSSTVSASAAATTPVGPKRSCCHGIGESTFRWGEWRNVPGIGEDFVYLLFRYTDCCLR